MQKLLALSCAAAALVLHAAEKKKPVTLDVVVSQRPPVTGPGAPVWARDGKRFVFREQDRLWLYDVGAKSRRELLAVSLLEAAAAKVPAPEQFPFVNRSVREEPVQWSASGRELLLSAGGDVFFYRIGAGGWSQLTKTEVAERDPKLSPDGRRVSFRREHDLYVLDIESKKITRLTHDGSATLLNGETDWVYPEELYLGTAHWWSPDSKSIAYLQFDVSREPVYPQVDLGLVKARLEPQRYPQAGDPNADVRLGIVPAGGGRTEWMDLGQTRDMLLARVYWSPDSKTVAAVRLNRIQNRLDLLFGDPKTGATRSVLRETDPYWINLREDLQFLKGGAEFLWSSERDGFNHLYRYASDGRLIAQLTRGEWEVTDLACVDEAGGSVYYVSTEAGPLERQFYRVSLEGGERRRISETAGTHAVNMAPGCGAYLDRFSSLSAPPRTTLRKNDGSEWALYHQPDTKYLDEYEILPSEIVELKAADGATLYGRLLKPAGFEPGKKYPVIVNVYGGPHAQQVTNAWAGGLSLDQVFAHQGYVVWALDNRGAAGRGHKFETPIFRNLGAVELEDQKAGVRRLVEMGIADPKRVGIMGWSYGGYMTLYSLLNAADVFAAGVAGAPVTHWRNYDTIYTERYMGLPADNPEGYRRSSPQEAASKLAGKLLLVHNLEDDNVLVQNSIQMAFALQRAGKPFEMMLYPPKAHGLSGPGRSHYTRLVVDFFDRHLRR